MDYATAILALSKTVHIANRVSFNEKLSIIAKGGQNSLQCVFDFDATISKAFHNGQRVSVNFWDKMNRKLFFNFQHQRVKLGQTVSNLNTKAVPDENLLCYGFTVYVQFTTLFAIVFR